MTYRDFSRWHLFHYDVVNEAAAVRHATCDFTASFLGDEIQNTESRGDREKCERYKNAEWVCLVYEVTGSM